MRKLGIVALGAAAAITLAGCASGGTGASDEGAEIRVWLVGTDTPDEARDYLKTHGSTVRDVMTRPVIGVRPSASLKQIARLLARRDIKRVPVLDAGRLVGIVSRADLVRQLAKG